MIVDFGAGKCPLCGDFGRKIEKKAYHCKRCDIAFDEFLILAGMQENAEEYSDKNWN